MRILSIETSCDETGIALLDCTGSVKAPRFKVIKHELTSQIAIHQPFGGVVPNLAKREHIANLPILYRNIFGTGTKELKLWSTIDVIAVTVGPGLEPALWTGITFAQELGKVWKKKVIGAHHMQGHLYSTLLPTKGLPAPAKKLQFPAIALVVSGGHTMLLSLKDLTHWKKLGETRDDAVGEAFDKVARLLELPYPGGPEIQRLAETGNPAAIPFPRPMAHEKNFDFSFSGLKTAVLYYLRDTTNANKADVAASFQEAAIDVLRKKTFKAAEAIKAKSIILAGGVAANKVLRDALATEAKKRKLNFIMPDMKFNTDNAAMIGAAAYLSLVSKPQKKIGIRAAKGRMPM